MEALGLMKPLEYHHLPQRRDMEEDFVHLSELGKGGWKVCCLVDQPVMPEFQEMFTGKAYLLCREIPERGQRT